MRRRCARFPILLLLCSCLFALVAGPAWADSAKEHAAAARKAAKSKDWKAALREWEEAYKLEKETEFLVGMGDACAKLGDVAGARAKYQAYLADPTALDADGVKAKLAALPKAPPAAAHSAHSGDLDLDAGPPVAVASGGKKPDKPNDKPSDKPSGTPRDRATTDDLSLALAPPPAASPPASPPKKGPTQTPAPAPAATAAAPPPAAPHADLDLSLPPAAPQKPAASSPPPAKPVVVAATPPAKPAAAPQPPAALAPPPGSQQPVKQKPGPDLELDPVVTKPPPPPPAPPAPVRAPAPEQAIATSRPAPAPAVAAPAGGSPLFAYVTTGLAVGALAVGGIYYTKAGSDADELHAAVRSGGEQAQILERERSNKALSFGALAAGAVLAGLAAALFVAY